MTKALMPALLLIEDPPQTQILVFYLPALQPSCTAIYQKLPPIPRSRRKDYPLLTLMTWTEISMTQRGRKQMTINERRETQERRSGVSEYQNRLTNCEHSFLREELSCPKALKVPFSQKLQTIFGCYNSISLGQRCKFASKHYVDQSIRVFSIFIYLFIKLDTFSLIIIDSSNSDRHQLVQQMQQIGNGALGPQAASTIRVVAAQNGVWSLGNFGGLPPQTKAASALKQDVRSCSIYTL